MAPIITDFIRNTQRELYDEKLADALEMLDSELNKDNDTKTQCNQLNTSPLHRGKASNKNGPARVKQRMQWEAPSKPLAVDDPLLLRVAFPTKERPLWYTTKSRSCLLVVNVNLRKSLTEMLVVRIGRRL